MLGTDKKVRELRMVLMQSNSEKRYVVTVALAYYAVNVIKLFDTDDSLAEKSIKIKEVANSIIELTILDNGMLINTITKMVKLRNVQENVTGTQRLVYTSDTFEEVMLLGSLFSESDIKNINNNMGLFRDVITVSNTSKLLLDRE